MQNLCSLVKKPSWKLENMGTTFDKTLSTTNNVFPYFHEKKIGGIFVFCLQHIQKQLINCVCSLASLTYTIAMQRKRLSALKVAQSCPVRLRMLIGKDINTLNFPPIADTTIICASIGSLGSPYLILRV